MNYHDDDALDRALAALPLEEPPARLHDRIMAATVLRPAPLASGWEVWLVGTLVAVAAWCCWLLVSSPSIVTRVAAALSDALENAGLTSEYTLLWLAVGVSAAWWVSQLTVPASRKIRVR
ncbi:MAG TPA: hypothetical protein VE826_15035 [Dongiaceae bacterium]|nr:hypothetical protein [Dongiaceae bacterium]